MTTTTERLGRSCEVLLGTLRDVRPDELHRATPCAGWDLRTLLLHVAGSADGFATMLTSGGFEQPPAPNGVADPAAHAIARVEQFARSHREATVAAEPGTKRAKFAQDAASTGAIELTVHAWDVATARGADPRVPDDHAADVLALVSSLLTDERRGDAFGPRVAVPVDAPAVDRLVAFLGRAPSNGGGGRGLPPSR
ncbi:TIGR03086 family metal-binding protein [Nocardioides sp. SYSU D00038]|uniref:TIGR03086 family metal-binding protein n=1 Tax=Nocardioides sp. SYSU D00038 TaxID=2812554 RepID=UPI0019678535|nr:TIGR03086 family metal-binding protein [Nocardioides sp. SYSU D00038]